MCGRFVAASPPEVLSEYFDATLGDGTAEPVTLPASFNVAPTNDVYAVVSAPDGRKVDVFHWGLVPAWAKDVKLGQKMINARAETLASKGAFKSAFMRRRCIVPMDGFYEWKTPTDPDAPKAKNGKPVKQPFFIHRTDGEPLAVAAIWERWHDPATPDDAPSLHSLTLVTTSANADMAPLHDRMPVLLPASVWDEWLDPDVRDLERLGRLLVPAPTGLLAMHPVSTAVNNVRNKGAELAEPLAAGDIVLPEAPSPTLFDA